MSPGGLVYPTPLEILSALGQFSGVPNSMTMKSSPFFFPGAKSELSDWRWLATPPNQSQGGLKAGGPT